MFIIKSPIKKEFKTVKRKPLFLVLVPINPHKQNQKNKPSLPIHFLLSATKLVHIDINPYGSYKTLQFTFKSIYLI